MTAVGITDPQPPTASDARVRRAASTALAVIVVLAPLSQVAAVLASWGPWDDPDPVASVYAHQQAYVTRAWFGQVGALTLAPATIAIGLLALRGSPVLALVGLVLTVPGLLNTDGNPEDLLYGAARAGIPMESARAAYEHLSELPALGPFGYYAYSLGFVVGGVILGVALFRGRIVPWWAGACLAASGVIGLLGLLTPLGTAAAAAVALIAWVLVTVAFTACLPHLVRPERA